jgi:hypothetical protein
LRQARARDDVDARHELLDQRLHRAGADQHGLLAAAPIEQPVGEDMAAVEVGGELDLVDRDEIDGRSRGIASTVQTQKRGRSGLIFSSPVTSATLWPDFLDDTAVDLARQQAQRQADHAGRVRDHPLDGEMGLAGIGRSEHRRDAASAERRRKGTGLDQDAGAFLQPARRNAGPALPG